MSKAMTMADEASEDQGLPLQHDESELICDTSLKAIIASDTNDKLSELTESEAVDSNTDGVAAKDFADKIPEKYDDVATRLGEDDLLKESLEISVASIDQDAAIGNSEVMSRDEPNDQTNQVDAPHYSDDDDDDDDDLFGDGDNGEEEEFNIGDVTTTEIESIPEVDHLGDTSKSADPLFDNDTSGEETKVETSSSNMVSTTIPRKNSATGVTASASPEVKKHTITYTKTVLSSLGLPEGILVPFSVDKEKLLNNNPNNRKMMDTLRSLPVKLVNDALSEYDDAVQVKGTSIRNHGAYLYGVVKRYVAVQERSISGGDGTGILPMGETLTVAVQSRLEQLVNSGFCTRDEMNDKVKSKIKMLPEKDALFALDELSSVSRSQIRNFGSYFMGILNRYMRGDDEKSKNNTGYSVGGQNLHSTSSPLNHKHGANLPPNLSNHQSSNTASHFQQRGRDRNSSHYAPPQGQHGNAYQNDRDRSRDRFSSQNENRRFSQPQSGRERNFNHDAGAKAPYDNRLQAQMPTWQQNAQQQEGMVGYANSINPNMLTQPYPSMPQQQQQYSVFQQQNSVQVQPNASNPYQPHTLAATSQFVSAQNYSSNPPASVSYGSQASSIVSSNPPYGVPSPQQPFIPPLQHQYQISAVAQPPGPNALYGRATNPQQSANMMMPQNQRTAGGWQQQQPAMPHVDIMGLADKAASAVQALQSRPPQQQAQVFSSQQYQQQKSIYGVVGGVQPISNQYPIVPAQMQGQIMQQQYSSAPQQQSNNFLHPTSQGSHTNQDSTRSRHTSASLGQLPHRVQYMIQNLIANQSLEGQLDDGILGMVNDLPEDLAMASLQKFASLDKSSMRNKTAYLAGVLRRELEKIQRR